MFVRIEKELVVKTDQTYAETKIWDMKKAVSEAKQNGLKMMFAVGGYQADSEFRQITSLTASKETRTKFLNSIIAVIDHYEIDGIEISWMWPPYISRVPYFMLIRDIREHLEKHRIVKGRADDYVLSITAPRNISDLNSYYFNEILKYVDFVNVLTDEYQYSNKLIGPISPLLGNPELSLDATMKYLVCQTKRPSKFNLVVPLFGLFWTNVTYSLNEAFPAPKLDAQGPYEMAWRLWKREPWSSFSVSWVRNQGYLSFGNQVHGCSQLLKMREAFGRSLFM
ncbi:hypothetical protein GCK72_020550 [Caenorhabditis remanei]|uniref:GH18 domain-containing protein n=1 Tax=Caenorhabditis remanei TaxID=31234 RepID=A0A6A5GHK6_CAERE|nr:hypothetical protein GCK72_020550 [Caenorhabditis remanei]KAF1753992.1 hypothetical protein GCK72_020550 [Caenorhabditis remanei]